MQLRPFQCINGSTPAWTDAIVWIGSVAKSCIKILNNNNPYVAYRMKIFMIQISENHCDKILCALTQQIHRQTITILNMQLPIYIGPAVER